MIFKLNCKKNRLKLIIALFFFILFASEAISKDDFTQYTIKAGGYFNSNFYFSDFTQLEGYPSCCQNFDFAYGIGYAAFIGVDYTFLAEIFGMKTSADMLFSFQNISANYSIEDKFANIITGNNYVEAITEHSLEPIINIFMVEPGVNITPFSNIPLSIRAGFQIGIPLSMTFVQEERILSPDWITYKETNSKIRYTYKGDIPNPANIYFGLSFGVKYSSFNISQDLSISPVINFNYGLTNLTNDLNWDYASLQAGFSLEYKISKPENIPPAVAPLPAYPQPLTPNAMEINTLVMSDSDGNLDSSHLQIKVFERQFISTNMLIPIIYFKLNSTEKINLSNSLVRTEELTQSKAYESVLSYLINHPEVKVEIYSSSVSTESIDTIKVRINKIKNYLLDNSIDNSRISIKEISKDASKMERLELMEDNCFIRFDFSDKTQMLTFWTDTLTHRIIRNKEFEVLIKPKSDFNKYSYNSVVYLDTIAIAKSISDNFSFEINENNTQKLAELKESKLAIKTKVKNEIFGEKTKEIVLRLEPKLVNDGVFENVISDIEQDNYVQQIVLGYCEFNQAEFSAINQDAIYIINQAFKEGKKIEIIPLFDFLGSDEHNQKLALSRAASAIKVLNLLEKDVEIIIPKEYFFSNTIPYGRMMNRAVIVRIKDLSTKY